MIENRSNIPGADSAKDLMDKGKTHWLFGLNPSDVRPFLKQFSLELEADLGETEYQERYFKPLGRRMLVSKVERTVQSRVTRS